MYTNASQSTLYHHHWWISPSHPTDQGHRLMELALHLLTTQMMIARVVARVVTHRPEHLQLLGRFLVLTLLLAYVGFASPFGAIQT